MAIIAICRGTKSGGTEMAECLADRLGYPLLGEEVVRDAAEHLGVTVELLEEKMGGRPTLWDPFSSLRRTYLLALQAALAERVVEGKLVYHGLAGGLLLRGAPATLLLRLVAPLRDRIEAVKRDSGMEDAEAQRYIRDVDAARSRWSRMMYDVDIADPALFDLVINLEGMSIEGACATTRKIGGRPEYEITDEVRAGLEDFRTTSRVKLALVEDVELRSLELDAQVEAGRVVVTGEAPLRSSGQMGNQIADVVRSVPGVDEVHLKIDWFDPYP